MLLLSNSRQNSLFTHHKESTTITHTWTGTRQPLLPRVSQGVGQAAREALQALLGRVQALEENSSVLMNSTQQNFGLIEDKANLGEFRKLQERVHQLQTILHVRDAAETEAKANPKPKPEAKDWAAQFNS